MISSDSKTVQYSLLKAYDGVVCGSSQLPP